MTSSRPAVLLKRDLDDLVGALIEVGVCSVPNFASVRDFGAVEEVSFSSAERVSLISSEDSYEELYGCVATARSFNARLIDGGLLQMMYRFRRGELIQHRLVFFPSPQLPSFQSVPEEYMSDRWFVEVISRKIVPFPLRFDFDDRDEVRSEIVHPSSHLTLGDAKGCRIPVTRPVPPKWFVDFVIRNFYQVEGLDILGKLPRCSSTFDRCITPNEERIIHLNVPA